MATALTQKRFNSFVNGIVTDANEFDAPENAVFDCDNINVNSKGEARRRQGLTPADSTTTQTVAYQSGTHDLEDVVTQCIEWDNAGADRATDLIAAQCGQSLLVWGRDSTDLAGNFIDVQSLGLSTEIYAWQMVPGEDGALYIFNTGKDPYRVTYSSGTLTATSFRPKIRDTKGVDDSLDVDESPVTLSSNHKYNLLNQGWTEAKINSYSGAVAVADAVIGTDGLVYECIGNHTAASGNKPITGGSWTSYWLYSALRISDIQVWQLGNSYSTVGSGSIFPTNAQQWFQGRDSGGNYSTAELLKLDFGKSPAPRGKYIYELGDIDRSTLVSGATDESITNLSFRCGAYYAGRIWYLGLTDGGYGATIFYSQLVSNTTNAHNDSTYLACYSDNDVTSEFFNEILETDGGRIEVPDMGIPIRSGVIGSALVIFTTKGIWAVSGGFGESFKPTALNVDQISKDRVDAPLSILFVEDSVYFWTKSGIKVLSPGQSPGVWSIVSLTDNRFDSGYLELLADNVSPTTVRGVYDRYKNYLEWSYAPSGTGNGWLHTKVLRYNLKSGAFTKYSFDPGVSSLRLGGAINNDADPNEVHYMIRSVSGSNLVISWSKPGSSNFYDYGMSESDAYITMWPVHVGAPGKDKTAPYLTTFLRKTEENWTGVGTLDYPSGATATVWWDYADSNGSEYQSGPHNIYRIINGPTDPGSGYPVAFDYPKSIIVNKTKVRGSGKSFQLKIESVDTKDFQFLGWSTPVYVETGE